MGDFQIPVDIANRGLQHCGGTRIASFTEDSKNASECAFVYDKVRRAELRRNVWRFSTRRAPLRPIDTTTMLLIPPLWDEATPYFPGSVVRDTDGVNWTTTAANNLGNEPGTDETSWDTYFGPMTITPWDSKTAYFSGELVYKIMGANVVEVYCSLVNQNDVDPAITLEWDATVTYQRDQQVMLDGFYYMSLLDLNTGNSPDAYVLYNATTVYGADDLVASTIDGLVYSSRTGGNVGHEPSTDGGTHWLSTGVRNPWTPAFIGGLGSDKWLNLGADVESINFVYPINAGPASQTASRNVYRLPNGWLREAPQDPKAGSNSYLGMTSGQGYADWTYEGDYIVTREINPIIYRFVADISDVRKMDPMFCEGLGARIGIEICEPVTQSATKIQTIAAAYSKFMTEARTVNGIETGSVEPAVDDYILTRR